MRAKTLQKQKKLHAVMTKEQFCIFLKSIGFNLKELSLVTSIPYRTLQDYKSGARGIPERVADKLQKELIKERKIRRWVYRNIEKHIEKEFPHGFASAPEEVEE